MGVRVAVVDVENAGGHTNGRSTGLVARLDGSGVRGAAFSRRPFFQAEVIPGVALSFFVGESAIGAECCEGGSVAKRVKREIRPRPQPRFSTRTPYKTNLSPRGTACQPTFRPPRHTTNSSPQHAHKTAACRRSLPQAVDVRTSRPTHRFACSRQSSHTPVVKFPGAGGKCHGSSYMCEQSGCSAQRSNRCPRCPHSYSVQWQTHPSL